MAHLLGTAVRLVLANQAIVTGILTEVDVAASTLTLSNADSLEHASLCSPYLVLQRADVVELQLLPTPAPQPAASPAPVQSTSKSVTFADPAILSFARPDNREHAAVPTQANNLPSSSLQVPAASTTSSNARRRRKKRDPVTSLLHPRGSEADESSAPIVDDSHDEAAGFGSEEDGLSMGLDITEDERMPHVRSRKGAKGRKLQQNGLRISSTNGHLPAKSGDGNLTDDFDFALSNAKFDKHKVFGQIAALDKTDPALLLHAHNKRQKDIDHRYTTKLLPTENVLDDMPAPDISSSGTEAPIQGARMVKGRAADTFIAGSAAITPFSAEQYELLNQVEDLEASSSLEQQIENAGRAIAELVLDPSVALVAADIIRPTIVLLIGSSSFKACAAIRAGVHLANRNAEVVAYVSRGLAEHPEDFKLYLQFLRSAGGRIITSVAHLPTHHHAAIDALQESEGSEEEQLDVPAADWANNARKTLCLNGVSRTSGLHSRKAILPSAILGLGAISHDSAALALNPAWSISVWMADLGIATSIYRRIAPGWENPWSRSWLVRVHGS